MPFQHPNSQPTSASASSTDELDSSRNSTYVSKSGVEERSRRRYASPFQSSKTIRPSTSQESTPSRPPWRRFFSTCKFLIADQWFLLALGFLVLVASQVQVPGDQQEKKEVIMTYLCVAFIFFVTGCTLSTKVYAMLSGLMLSSVNQFQS